MTIPKAETPKPWVRLAVVRFSSALSNQKFPFADPAALNPIPMHRDSASPRTDRTPSRPHVARRRRPKYSDKLQVTSDKMSNSYCLTLTDPVAMAPGTDSVARQTNIAATAHRDVGTMDLRDGHLSAYLQSPRLR